MTLSSWTVRRTVLAVGVLALTAGTTLSGCASTDEPAPQTQASEPAASATPSVDPVEAAEAALVEEAKAAYLDIMALENEVAQAGGGEEQWQRIAPFYASDQVVGIHQYYTTMAQEGSHQVGEITYEIGAAEFEGDPLATSGTDQVTFDVCIDATGAQIVRPAGKSSIATPIRAYRAEVVVRSFDGGPWVETSNTTDEEEC